MKEEIYDNRNKKDNRLLWTIILNKLDKLEEMNKFIVYRTLPVSWETCMWVKEQRLEPDMEQLTGSKLGKGYDKAVYCCPV